MQERLFAKAREGGVEILFNRVLDEVVGDGQVVTGAKVRCAESGEISELTADGVFIAVGHQPNTDAFAGQLPMENGHIVTRAGRNGMATATDVAGVFAAGDVQDYVYRQAVTSAASGCMAALDAAKYLEENGVA